MPKRAPIAWQLSWRHFGIGFAVSRRLGFTMLVGPLIVMIFSLESEANDAAS